MPPRALGSVDSWHSLFRRRVIQDCFLGGNLGVLERLVLSDAQ
jgi:hypothetical protein